MKRHIDEHGSQRERTGGKCLLALTLAVAALGASAPQAFGATPTDPSFGLQWADSNAGQFVPVQNTAGNIVGEARGTPGADEGALWAWQQVTTGSRSIVTGVVDTGVEFKHPDLAANMFTNPGGVGGCGAGSHGYDVLKEVCEPLDEDTAYDGHGTHVAGIIGAVGNNEVGVAGMNWQTTLLPVRWLQSAGSPPSLTEQALHLIDALQWLVRAKKEGVNVRVVNDSVSFEGTPYEAKVREAIEELGNNDILFVTAAGNAGKDDDDPKVQRYPCKYHLANEICVTASDNKDQLPTWANHGGETVDLAAPGASIYSTLREASYGYLSGSSMAAAQVSGAAALILSAEPWLSSAEVKADILANVRREPWLSGYVATSGVLDVCKALPNCTRPAPAPRVEVPAPAPRPVVAPASTPAGAAHPGVLVIASSLIPVSRGRAQIRLQCMGTSACRAQLTLTATPPGRKRAGARSLIPLDTVALPGHAMTTLVLRLNRAGRALLDAARGRLAARLTIRGLIASTYTHTDRVRLVSVGARRR